LRDPHPWEGFLLVGAAVLIFTLGAPLAQDSFAGRFLILPGVAFLMPAVLWAWARGMVAQVFTWKSPTRRALVVASTLIAGGSLAALGLAGVLTAIFGESGETPLLRALLFSVGPARRLLFFAAAPALCEEALFRGALLRCVRPWGIGTASLVSALTFAAIHASWMKFLPVAILGWVLAQVVLRTGNFWLAVGGHALHNGIVLGVLGWDGARIGTAPLTAGIAVPVVVAGLAMALVCIGKAKGWGSKPAFLRA
jgi:membrane protease YdiL (CAAX protease family)